jgi:hypothetical protein
MPSKSPQQARFMAMMAKGGKKKGKGKGPPKEVAQEFMAEDKKSGMLKGKRKNPFGGKR